MVARGARDPRGDRRSGGSCDQLSCTSARRFKSESPLIRFLHPFPRLFSPRPVQTSPPQVSVRPAPAPRSPQLHHDRVAPSLRSSSCAALIRPSTERRTSSSTHRFLSKIVLLSRQGAICHRPLTTPRQPRQSPDSPPPLLRITRRSGLQISVSHGM